MEPPIVVLHRFCKFSSIKKNDNDYAASPLVSPEQLPDEDRFYRIDGPVQAQVVYSSCRDTVYAIPSIRKPGERLIPISAGHVGEIVIPTGRFDATSKTSHRSDLGSTMHVLDPMVECPHEVERVERSWPRRHIDWLLVVTP